MNLLNSLINVLNKGSMLMKEGFINVSNYIGVSMTTLAVTILITVWLYKIISMLRKGEDPTLYIMVRVIFWFTFCSLEIGNIKAATYERVLKMDNNIIVRSWSGTKPKCSEVLSDCENIKGVGNKECTIEVSTKMSAEKCVYNYLTGKSV